MTDIQSIPILTLRGIPVLIDADLARLYKIPSRALNQAVRRNPARFPEDFLFRLTPSEKSRVITNCDHLQPLKFSKTLPHAFTEHGTLMAANVLNSPQAVKMSVFIIRLLHTASRRNGDQFSPSPTPRRSGQKTLGPRHGPTRSLPVTPAPP